MNTGVVSLDINEWAKIKFFAANGRSYASRLSIGLVVRLLTEARDDAPFVLHAIDMLEGLRPDQGIKGATQFKHAPLHPLWHQHFSAPRHALRNIGLHWGVDRGGNSHLDKMMGEVARTRGDAIGQWPGIVAHRFAFEGYVERSNADRLTGDWIIFSKHDGANYYLDLATHEEALLGKANRLVAKLRNSSAAEFPFAFDPSDAVPS